MKKTLREYSGRKRKERGGGPYKIEKRGENFRERRGGQKKAGGKGQEVGKGGELREMEG